MSSCPPNSIGALVNSSRSNFSSLTATLESAAANLGLQKPDYHDVTGGGSANQIEDAIEDGFKTWQGNGLKVAVVTADPLFNNHRDKVIDVARKYKIAAIYQWSEFASAGGLMSYGTNLLRGVQVSWQLCGPYSGRR